MTVVGYVSALCEDRKRLYSSEYYFSFLSVAHSIEKETKRPQKHILLHTLFFSFQILLNEKKESTILFPEKKKSVETSEILLIFQII